MRAIVQRVTQASVTVDGAIVGEIGKGLCVLVGIMDDDAPDDMEFIARKLLSIKCWEDDTGRPWRVNVVDGGLELLLVSQFTLYAQFKGTKPDFHKSMGAGTAVEFYNNFVNLVKSKYDACKIQEGEFQAMMSVNIVNDGPVTFQLDSRKFEYIDQPAAPPSGGSGGSGSGSGSGEKTKSKSQLKKEAKAKKVREMKEAKAAARAAAAAAASADGTTTTPSDSGAPTTTTTTASEATEAATATGAVSETVGVSQSGGGVASEGTLSPAATAGEGGGGVTESGASGATEPTGEAEETRDTA